jgi:segregation and condensation protein A
MLRMQLVRVRTASFRTLCADCQNTLEVVARFLALLELFRDGLVGFVQEEALGDLTVRWTGPDNGGAGGLDVDEYGEDEAAQDNVAESEPVHGEPVHGEPVQSEPVQSEPVQSQPARGENVLGAVVQDDSVEEVSG